jgi:nicotinamidase-related amidase
MSPRPALLVLDLINEITHEQGRFPEVCLEQVRERGVLEKAALAIELARRGGIPVVFVVVGFSPGYLDWSPVSPLFTHVPEGERLVLGTWATEVHAALAPLPHEPVVAKRRLSPFHGTHLDALLRNLGVDSLLLVGATTDLAVLSTAREAHDRDYRVSVLEDATATGDAALHAAALTLLARTATVTTVEAALRAAGQMLAH